jgi:gp16 family phage-associated protein
MDSQLDKTTSGVPLPDPTRVEAARLALKEAGQSVPDWAQANGEQTHTVYKVLSGRRACIMGDARRIAIKLGILDDASAVRS